MPLKKKMKPTICSSFDLIEESMTEGWRIGAITEYLEENACLDGDAFVEAPDGSRAFVFWETGIGKTVTDARAGSNNWGVYNVFVPKPVKTTEDFIENFRSILPELKELYDQTKKKTKAK